MIKVPHWTILCIALGTFLLPIMGGHLSLEGGKILANDSLIGSILIGEQAPFLAHFLISLLFFVPICANLCAKKITHVVNIRISFWLALLGACIGVSIALSSFPSVTLGVVLEWAMMSMAFFAITLCCGRKQSVIPILTFIGGATVAAVIGIMEFRDLRVIDPGYRISAMQLGPNQAGALFAAGTILCLSMALRFDRVGKLGLIICAILQCFALILTQSKGAILCLPIGVLVLVAGLLVLRAAKPSAILGGIVVPLILIGGLAMMMQQSVKSQTGGQVVSRVMSSGSEANQSQEFRKLLWSSAIDLTKLRPFGWGMGSFWFESTRPGKVTQTTLAHQTFLQLACEASPVAALSLIGFLGSVVVWGFRGIKTQAADSQIFLVGVFATLSVAIAHNLVDSDMYVFGLGAFVFLLCGSFVASSSDSQAPEFIFALPKIAFGASALLLLPICLIIGLSEMYRAIARGAIEVDRDQDVAISATNSALAINFIDGTAYSQRAFLTGNQDDFINATRLHPTPKAFRALSKHYLSKNMHNESFSALNKALERDPNNASALLKYIEEAFAINNDELGIEKSKQLIATENSTYFKVRSQPEFVPTQTYIARLFLAAKTTDRAENSRLLSEAIKGFAQYRDITGRMMKRQLAVDPKLTIGGEDIRSLLENYGLGQKACSDLLLIQGVTPRDLGFSLTEEAAKFASAIGDLEGLNK